MREILTALAIFVIVLLTAALVAPYFVDWSSQRAFVEARLSHALGQKVTIGGAIDLKLLPTPYLVLDQAVIGSDDGPISLGIHHLRLELAVTPLLHGEFEVVEAELDEPTIRLTLQDDRTLPPLPDAPAFRADVRFDKVSIADGLLAIADPQSGRTFAFDHLDLEAEAGSLAGPFKGAGAAGRGAGRTKFRFASSVAQRGKARVKLLVEETPVHPSVELDGTLALAGIGKDRVRQTFVGTGALGGHIDEGSDVTPWRLSGPVSIAPERVSLDDGEFRLGTEDHNVTLAATGDADLGEAPAAELSLTGKQLDLDRLSSVPPGNEATAPPKVSLPPPAVLSRVFRTPLPTRVDLSIPTATYAGAAYHDLEAHFVLGDGGAAAPLRFAGAGPGGAHVAVEGHVAPSWSRFAGTVAFGASDAPTAARWLASLGLPGAEQTIPFRFIDLSGAVTIGDGTVAVKSLALRLDRSSLSGSARIQAAKGAVPARLDADLTAKALDLDALPDLSALRTAAAVLDLDLKLDAHGIKVAHVGGGPLDAGRIRLALVKTGGHFDLTSFHVEGLGGATIDATATLDPQGAKLDARLDADRLTDSAALLRRVAPSPWSDALAARATALAPTKLRVDAAFDADEAPRSVVIAGTLGATRLDATLSPDATDARKVVAKAVASAPEGAALLRQIGFAALPLDTLGASRITLDARGPAGGSLAGSLHAALGATTIDVTGHATLAAAERGGSGTLKLASPDASPLLRTLAVAFPDLIGRIPVAVAGGVAWTPAGLSLADLSGRLGATKVQGSLAWAKNAAEAPLSGSLTLDHWSLATLLSFALGPADAGAPGALWSAQPFSVGLLDPPRSSIALRIGRFDLGQGLVAEDAGFSLGLSQGLVAMKSLKARLAGGALSADLSIRRDGPLAALEGRIAADGLSLALPGAVGKLSIHTDLAGSGRSASALVASLAGTGEATIKDLVVPHADPAALTKVFADVESDALSVDESSIVRALDAASAGALSMGDRRFALNLAAGVLHLDPPEAAAPAPGAQVSATLQAALDLRTLALDEHVDEVLRSLPADWSGPPPHIDISLAGPLRSPRRSVDITGFVNALATRALARESARIEAYESDVRERAFFNQRLERDRLHEDERRKADEDAKAADAARKAEAEQRAKDAAKLDRARKAEEAAREKAAAEAQGREKAEPKPASPAPAGQRPPSPAAQPGAERLNQPAFQSLGKPIDPSAAGRY